MKIVYIITTAHRGGAQNNVVALANDQVRRGSIVRVVAGFEGDWLQSALCVTLERAPIIRTWNPAAFLRFLYWLKHYIDAESPDVIHLHSSHPLIGLLLARFASHIKWIFTVHGLSLYEQSGLRACIYRSFFKWLIPKADHVLFECESDRRVLLHTTKLSSERTSVISSSIPPIKFYTREVARRRLGISPNVRVVGTVGRYVPQKAQDILIRAFCYVVQDHPDAELCLVGYGPLQEQLSFLSQELGVAHRVHFLQGDARVLKGFDVFVNTALYEGFPYVLLEAGLAGVPIVATDVGGISEFIESGKTGILTSHHPKEIANAIVAVFREHRYQDVLKDVVHTDYSEARMCDQTDVLYRR